MKALNIIPKWSAPYLKVLNEIADGKNGEPEVPLPGLPVESTLGRN